MIDNRDIYNDLIEQYNLLDEQERKAIVIYKSKLFRLINLITSIQNFEYLSVNEIIEKLPNVDELKKEVLNFKQILDRPENIIVKYSYFKDVNFNDFNLLVNYLRNIYFILENLEDKIVLKEDLTVYRGVSIDDFNDLKELAVGNLISTSIKPEDVEPYMNSKKQAAFYIISLKKGTSLLVAPISLVRSYKDRDDFLYKKLNGISATSLKLVDRGKLGVEEIILFKNTLDFVEEKVEIGEIDGKMVAVHFVEAFPKNKNIKRNNR